MMPIVFAIWDDFIDIDGLYLAQIAHEYPIILVCRPKISYFHGNGLLEYIILNYNWSF